MSIVAYLHIPIALPGAENGSTEDRIVKARLLPQTVTLYHEGFNFGVCIYTPNGVILSTWTVEEYEKAVDNYWLQIGKKAAKNMITPQIFKA